MGSRENIWETAPIIGPKVYNGKYLLKYRFGEAIASIQLHGLDGTPAKNNRKGVHDFGFFIGDRAAEKWSDDQ